VEEGGVREGEARDMVRVEKVHRVQISARQTKLQQF
jgi:hypothetical protein